MLQVLPSLTAAQHVDRAGRYAELASPLGAGGLPAVLLLVPIVQDLLRLVGRELGVRRVLAAQPHVGTIPTVDSLERAGDLLARVTQTVVANLIDRELWVHTRDFGVQVPVLGQL